MGLYPALSPVGRNGANFDRNRLYYIFKYRSQARALLNLPRKTAAYKCATYGTLCQQIFSALAKVCDVRAESLEGRGEIVLFDKNMVA